MKKRGPTASRTEPYRAASGEPYRAVPSRTEPRPTCPRCGESDLVLLPGEPCGPTAVGQAAAFGFRTSGFEAGDVAGAFCDRCKGYVAYLEPRPGRHAPDFPGTPMAKPKPKPRRGRKARAD